MLIRQSFLLIGFAIVLLLGAIFYLITLDVRNLRELEGAEDRRYASFKLADELRQSSDDLTRMARTYVVTGNPVYEAYFRRILAIRNGEVARPENYTGTYWDFVVATGEPPGLDGETVALEELMRRADFTPPEFAALRQSLANSNALAALEDQAIAAVKGLYLDAQGRYTVKGEPNMGLARDLLHGSAYHQAKAEIMEPIQKFTDMVEARTAQRVDALRARSARIARMGLILMGMAVAMLVLGLLLLQGRVFRPVGELAAAANLAESGDYSGRVPVRTKDEIGLLTRAFNRMADAIEGDIAAREQSARALAEARASADAANEAKSGFLAKMSHELRTPMNAIIGYSEMLTEDAEEEGNQEAVEDLRKIHTAGKHLLALINDVLDLSKIEAGKMDLHLETFEIPAMIDDVVSTTDTLVRKNGNLMRVEVDPSLGEMRADVTKVRQSLFNLISNAAKFTEQGEIALVIRPERENGVAGVQMSVTDSGIGIPEDRFEHVFDEFSQAEEITSMSYGGTGLGLPITRRFCDMMGGEITLRSTLGEGSTFTIWLPLVVSSPSDKAAATPVPAVEPKRIAERTVLVVDDDPNALDLIGRTLQAAGVRVVTASDGAEALRLARSLHPAAMTLDVVMPGMDGWEVLREIKADAATRDIPVIMVSMTDDQTLGYALGATEFLTKPVERDQLVGLLERHTGSETERHALVVDDLVENRDVLRRALEREGWHVSEAENGRAALERVAERNPSLILLDLMMPVMDGFEFVAEMRKIDASRDIPIVVVTAKDITDEDRRRLNGGVVGLIENDGHDLDSLLAQQLSEHLSSALGERE